MELAVEVPLGVEGVVERAGREDLSAHGHLAVGVALTWRTTRRQEEKKGEGERVEERLSEADGVK